MKFWGLVENSGVPERCRLSRHQARVGVSTRCARHPAAAHRPDPANPWVYPVTSQGCSESSRYLLPPHPRFPQCGDPTSQGSRIPVPPRPRCLRHGALVSQSSSIPVAPCPEILASHCPHDPGFPHPNAPMSRTPHNSQWPQKGTAQRKRQRFPAAPWRFAAWDGSGEGAAECCRNYPR